ncbi:hypothetical protein RHSIM_Rhsim09G0034700 [Rhododendron simsii]|uniref:Uncharacterized protein n=1 Tax=Rhododendron simsii TaxID=118357 RepID=A0A834LEK0_RHOSS|nr:hypothetical protein RHSIM_Rhsim09G0034700 [Rhododendron simsii]
MKRGPQPGLQESLRSDARLLISPGPSSGTRGPNHHVCSFSAFFEQRGAVDENGVEQKGDVCFWYVKQGVIVEGQSFACFVTDGAWDKTTGREAAADWVEEQQLGQSFACFVPNLCVSSFISCDGGN